MRRPLLLALVLAAGCGATATAPPDVSGTYVLARVAGVATPAPLPGGVDGAPATVTGGSVVIEADGRWRAEVRLVVGPSGAATTVSDLHAGSYVVSRDTVRLHDTLDGTTFHAVARGARLTALVEGVAFDFDR